MDPLGGENFDVLGPGTLLGHFAGCNFGSSGLQDLRDEGFVGVAGRSRRESK